MLINRSERLTFAPYQSENSIVMGKGDPKSKKGKMFKGSYGNSRPRRANKVHAGASATPQPAAAGAKGKK